VRPQILAAGVLLTLAVPTSVLAQGNSKKPKAPAPPSRNDLTATAVVTSPSSATSTPIAWVDDATLLPAGMVAVSVSAMRWANGGVSEVDAPVVNASFGLAPRVQLSASVPRVVGSADPAGAAGGVGTSFFSAKVALYGAPALGVKVATAPTLQLLGGGIVEPLGVAQSRVRFGLPVSAEISHGTARLYGGAGYFSPGLWFGGIAAGVIVTPKVGASVGVSRAWRTSDTLDVPLSDRDRNELSASVSYALHPAISLFGTLGRTFATLDENGAGTSIGGGVSIFFGTDARRP